MNNHSELYNYHYIMYKKRKQINDNELIGILVTSRYKMKNKR